jgi:hypothetical protein
MGDFFTNSSSGHPELDEETVRKDDGGFSPALAVVMILIFKSLAESGLCQRKNIPMLQKENGSDELLEKIPLCVDVIAHRCLG